ncbi:MAG: aminoacyl-tRNA hydrolase, partial [Pseudomonadota bacterium]
MDKATMLIHTSKPPRPKLPKPEKPAVIHLDSATAIKQEEPDAKPSV